MKTRLILVGLAVGIVAACGNNLDNPAADYAHRLANVLSVEAATTSTLPITFPKQRELKLDLAEHSIGINEFLRLRECKLHSALAAKNTLLGKQAPPSQSLINDLRILHHAPACIAQLKDNNKEVLAERLAALVTDKKSQLASLVWRAILGSTENASFWSSGKFDNDYPNSLPLSTAEAIQGLRQFTEQLLSGDFDLSEAEESQFELNLKALKHGDGGRLLFEFVKLSAGLETANGAIEKRVDRALCLNNSANSKAEYLQNVVGKFFIGQVQTHAISLTQRYRQIIEPYRQLESLLLQSAPENYSRWANLRQSAFANGLAASKRHVSFVQKIYSQCGLRAG